MTYAHSMFLNLTSTHVNKWKRLHWCGGLLEPPPHPYSWLPGYSYLHPQGLCYLHPPPRPPRLRQSGGAVDSSSRSRVRPGIPAKLRYHSGPLFRKAATGNGPSPETKRTTAVKHNHILHTSTHSQHNLLRVLIKCVSSKIVSSF